MSEKKFNKQKKELLKKIFDYSMSSIESVMNSSHEDQYRWLTEVKKYKKSDVLDYIFYPNLIDFYVKCFPINYEYDESFTQCMILEISLSVNHEKMSYLYWSIRALILKQGLEVSIDQIFTHLINQFSKNNENFINN